MQVSDLKNALNTEGELTLVADNRVYWNVAVNGTRIYLCGKSIPMEELNDEG